MAMPMKRKATKTTTMIGSSIGATSDFAFFAGMDGCPLYQA